MRHALNAQESYLIEDALSEFIHRAIASQKKAQKIRQNMEYRRKLEQRSEEKRLQQEIGEFDFDLG